MKLASILLMISTVVLFADNLAELKKIEENYNMHTIQDFIQIMQKSKVSYTISEGIASAADTTQFTLPKSNTSTKLTPYSRIQTSPDGTKKIIEDLPKGQIKDLFDKATPLVEEENWAEVKKLFLRATQIEPKYFKAWSNLAQAYLYEGNTLQAIGYLKKAISLNPIAYYEYYLLALALQSLGDSKEALSTITKAFMINREDSKVLATTKLLLDVNGKKLNDNHQLFPFKITRSSSNKCTILLIGQEGEKWAAMAAVWLMEPEFIKIDKAFSAAGRFNSIKFYEIFFCQFAEIAKQLDEKKSVTSRERTFFNIISKEYILQVIAWDIVGNAYPEVLAFMNPEEKKKLETYIETFVYVPKPAK
jgi:tetratricopeptide (TPR) repeat protein